MPTTRESDARPAGQCPPAITAVGEHRTGDRRRYTRLARHVVGWSSLAIGLVGLLVPVMPQWPFIIWGMVTLAPDVPIFARLLGWMERKMPKLRPLFQRMRGDDSREQR